MKERGRIMRRRIRTWALGASLLASSLAPPLAAGARPADAERAAGIHGTLHDLEGAQLAHHRPPDGLRKAFAATLLAGARDLAARKGLGAEARVDTDEFARFVDDRVEGALDERWAKVRTSRNAGALAGLARRASGDRWAETTLAAWLGVTRPEESELSEAATDMRPRLSAQLSTSSRGTIRLRPELSSIAAESGGPGAGNSVVDAGEWVKLSLALQNTGDAPWFSTSAWVETGHECLFADPEIEHELSEIGPGETAALEAWIYLSRECPDEASLTLLMRDTHRSGGQQVTVQLEPRTAVDARLVGTLIDADVPGWSDRGEPTLEAGRRIEIASDLQLVRGHAQDASMVYVLDESALELMASADLRLVPMVRRSSRMFEAGDDLDIEGADDGTFSSTLSGLRYRSRWFQGDTSVLWLGTDTTLWARSPDPPDGESTEPATDEPSSLTSTDFEAIGALVHEHLRLVASPTIPELPGAVAAAEGYEVLFDRAGFMEGLARLAGPAPAPATAGGGGRPEQVAYRFRHYVALRVEGAEYPDYTPPPPEPAPEPEPEYEPVRHDDPPPRIEDRDPRTVFHLDPTSIQWRTIGGHSLSNYSLTLGLATIDRPVGFYLLTGFQPIPDGDEVVIPLRMGAQFNSNGIPSARQSVPWLNVVFQVGGTLDVMVEEEIFFGFEVGPAVDFFLTDQFSLGTGVVFGAGGGILDGGEFRHTRWDILRLQFSK